MIGLADRSLYLCTPERKDLEAFVADCIAGGVDIVQLRDKQLDDAGLRHAATRIQAVCREHGVPFIMNDRPDLAVELGADGVHVGQDDASVSLCREILGPDAIIGLSTHALPELEIALGEDVSYLSAGPVISTPTKPGRPGTGVGYAATASQRARVPVFVTGGVSPEAVPELVAAGLRHFVVVRYLTEAANPRRAASLLRSVIDETLFAQR